MDVREVNESPLYSPPFHLEKESSVCRLPTEHRTRLVVRIFHQFHFVLVFVHVCQYLNLAIARLYLWATKKVTFFENWLLFLIGQYFMYVL